MKLIRIVRNVLWCLLLMLVVSEGSWAQSGKIASRNDHIFPAAAEARSYIDFDSRGFLVHGKRTFIVSAGIEYARVPRGLWRDRLLKLKRGGFNTVEIYTFWNYHEQHEGEFNFSGDRDLDAFLKLVDEMGMYAIVRVGPYYCGEWALGGYPVWLKFKPGLRVREDDGPFLAAVSNFFDRLIPIVAGNQINRGGSVIMVQLENEHRAGWGTVTPNKYFQFLIDKTVSLGLQVPYYFSGLHPGNDPAGNLKSLDDPKRPNPWFSAEYWGVWFSNYGPQPQDSTIYDRRTWKIVARGGNGYNVYMAHGGTNFEYYNDRDMAASYDYGAAIGQTGDLRPIYYSYKRAAWFARSFQDILANSMDATGSDHLSSASDTAIVITARRGPAGTITFLDNSGTEPVRTRITAPGNLRLPSSDSVTIAPGEIVPVVHNYPLGKNIKLAWSPCRIYGIASQGNTTTLLVYGASGSVERLYFNINQKATLIEGPAGFRELSPETLELSADISPSVPSTYSFEVEGHRIRIIAVNNLLAQRSWFVEAGNDTDIVIGPAYVSGMLIKGRRLSLVTERSWQDSIDLPLWLYKPFGAPVRLIKKPGANRHMDQLKLGRWQAKNASEPVLPGYDDRNWKLSDIPLQMGADGDVSANAWYRTKINVPETGAYILKFRNIRDRAALFLDGRRIDTGEVLSKAFNIDLKAGTDHSLTVYAAHSGRNKQIFYIGPLDTVDAKGLTGPVTLKKSGDTSSPEIVLDQWRMKGGPGDPDSRTGWRPLSSPVGNSPHFFRTTFTLPSLPGTTHIWRVITTSLSHGSVWVNGHNLGRYPEKIKINGLYIPENWLKKGRNTLVVYDENGITPSEVTVKAEAAVCRDITIYTQARR